MESKRFLLSFCYTGPATCYLKEVEMTAAKGGFNFLSDHVGINILHAQSLYDLKDALAEQPDFSFLMGGVGNLIGFDGRF
jgi:hypothetical protein